MGPLFEEPSEFDREGLAARLANLARQGIYLGGSSWKYEGWLGQVYTWSRYLSRGRFSRKVFEAECLKEYSETFPVVCGDFAFYQFPTEEFWRKLFGQTPAHFRFGFKVPEQITCKMFPAHLRYGPAAGQENESFLDAAMVRENFLRPLEPYREKTGVLIFEFGAFPRKAFEELEAFLDCLDPFLRSLPPDFRYAVEVRNPEFLSPAYFECLRKNRVAHVFNAWARMPVLREQIAMPGSVTTDFVVSRALLKQGRPYEKAVELFAPYARIQDPNPEARESLRVLIEQAREQRHLAFLFVNNRLEGNAPSTIFSVVDPEFGVC